MAFLDFIKTPAFALAVVFALALIYTLYAKVKENKTAKAAKPAAEEKAAVSSSPAAPAAEGICSGTLDLVDTDEKTAAVIMALVSYKSGIPLNRLSFKSIRLMEDK